MASFETRTTGELAEALAAGEELQVLDVRSPGEWEAGHLEGSVHRYVPQLRAGLPDRLDRSEAVWVGLRERLPRLCSQCLSGSGRPAGGRGDTWGRARCPGAALPAYRLTAPDPPDHIPRSPGQVRSPGLVKAPRRVGAEGYRGPVLATLASQRVGRPRKCRTNPGQLTYRCQRAVRGTSRRQGRWLWRRCAIASRAGPYRPRSRARGGRSMTRRSGAPAGGSGKAPRLTPKVRRTFIALLLAMAIAGMDYTIVSTALPTIVGEMGALTLLPWVLTANVLASTVTVPLYGKLSDVFGRRRLMHVAILLFVVGSCAAGLSQGIGQLIACRAVQGAGSAGLISLSYMIIGDMIPPATAGPVPGVHKRRVRGDQRLRTLAGRPGGRSRLVAPCVLPQRRAGHDHLDRNPQQPGRSADDQGDRGRLAGRGSPGDRAYSDPARGELGRRSVCVGTRR